ncbi:MAG: SLC13 family permease [Rhodococcus sp. (in: high G+C Gram-positive bacteria)]
MITPEIVAVIGLVAIFAIAMWRSLNMGAVALVVAFVLGVWYFDLTPAEIADGFPGSLFVTLLGVTYLFGIARANGTVDAIVSSAVGLVRGRVAMIPWIFFLLAAVITGAGALSAATNAILIPVGLAFATRYRISPLLVGLCVLNGTNAGGFSPISVYFSIVNKVFADSGVTLAPGPIFLWTFLANLVLNVAAFFLLGGRELLRRGAGTDEAEPTATIDSAGSGGVAVATKPHTWAKANILTVTLLVGIVAVALAFSMDVGFLALTAAVVLAALYPRDSARAVEQIGWGVILLIGGIVTYISVLQGAGVIDDLARTVSTIGVPLVAALTILFVAGIVSAFASTNAMFAVLVPLAAPLVLLGEVSTVGFVVALCIAASAVDSSPFSTGGALIVANTEEKVRDKTFRGLLIWGMSMIVIAPTLAWLFFVLPT